MNYPIKGCNSVFFPLINVLGNSIGNSKATAAV